ncbi:hypothetical protein IG631_01921 [Alternaria alternata]|nr:hypothetical protein IG631_01921 [Alternaria alternata]
MSLISITDPKPSSRAWGRRKDGLVEVRIGAIIGKSASVRHTRGEFTVSAAHFIQHYVRGARWNRGVQASSEKLLMHMSRQINNNGFDCKCRPGQSD